MDNTFLLARNKKIIEKKKKEELDIEINKINIWFIEQSKILCDRKAEGYDFHRLYQERDFYISKIYQK